jgi:hypothetical protein
MNILPIEMTCSIDACQRAAACLCRHCQKNVCVKHFSEHQEEVNKRLLPFVDRLNTRKTVHVRD